MSSSSCEVAAASGYILWPLRCALAALTAAYAHLKCAELYAEQCWFGSRLTPAVLRAEAKHPEVDFYFWVRYGSWSLCPWCGVFWFNDEYFKGHVYQHRDTSSFGALLQGHRQSSPSDPVVHAAGRVGVSSHWWYLASMYKPQVACGACTTPTAEMIPSLAPVRYRSKSAPRYTATPAPDLRARIPIQSTGQLYRVPRVGRSPQRPWAR